MKFTSDNNRQYEINGFLFFPEQKVIERLRDHHKLILFPQEAEILELLLINANEVVSNEKIAREFWKAEDVKRAKAKINQAIYRLRQILGKEMIKTEFSEGYRFVGDVNRQSEFSSTQNSQEKSISPIVLSQEPKPITTPSQKTFSDNLYFVITESLIYSAVAVVSLYLETAYQFSEFRQIIFFWSIPVLVISFILIVSCFWLIYILCVRRKSDKGIIFGAATLLFSVVVIVALGYQILPNYSVTQATFSTQSAQFAYLKNLGLYLFPIFLAFVMVPYISVLVWERELFSGNNKKLLRFLRSRFGFIKGTPNISAKWMIFCLFLLFLYSLSTMFYLFDHLELNENTNRFIHLVILRNALYFLAALIGIWWYYENKKRIIAQCRNI
jgi:DNA-binding winged helix-turn-helix (wHTH) protein